MKKLRIALIHNSSPTEGGSFTYENNVAEFIRNTPDKDFEIFEFFVGKRNSSRGGVNSYNPNRIALLLATMRHTSIGYDLLRIIGLGESRFERYLKESQIDIVYFLSPNPMALAILDIETINTVWDLGHLHYPNYAEFSFEGRFAKREYFYSKVLPRSSKVIVDSELTKKEICAIYGLRNSRVTPMGLFPNKRGHECTQVCGKERYIFYPAQFWRHKNHSTVIHALKYLVGKYPDLKLYLSGSDKGTREEMENLVETLELNSNVEFLGFVSDEEMGGLYQHAELTVFPSILGYTNLPPLESLLHETPVLVSDCHKFDVALNPRMYKMLPAFDIRCWAIEIEKLITDQSPRVSHETDIFKPSDEAVFKKIFNTNTLM